MHLDRLITVLETVAAAGRAISPSDLQAATGLPRPTCYRLLQSLAEQRLLEEPEAGRYRIGRRLTRIALAGQTDTDIADAAAPSLKETSETLGEAVFLSRLRGDRVEIIHVETPSDPARSFIHPGLGARPIHACSCSKAIAAFAEDSFQQLVLNGPMRAYTEHTNTSADWLSQEFDKIREDGYAQCVEEIEIGVCSVAAPVRIGAAGVPFSVGATGPVRRFTAPYRGKIGTRLMDLAERVSGALQLRAD